MSQRLSSHFGSVVAFRSPVSVVGLSLTAWSSRVRCRRLCRRGVCGCSKFVIEARGSASNIVVTRFATRYRGCVKREDIVSIVILFIMCRI